MIDFETVDLSRLQFALTALYHFLFVPLTMGLAWLLVIMESVYVMTGREIWRQMTKFWGLLFGINFAMGVATGITMEFQFGTNWAYYSHFVGDIFGAPLAIEGLMAFFMEATFVGLFFFGWERLSKVGHLFVTWMVAIGTNFSAMWILVANAWMQHPVGAEFNPETLRMEVTSFSEMFFSIVAQAKFVHTVSAGYVTGSVFVISISAYYLLRGRNIAFAKRSMTVAASFGLASALSVVVLGDESGYTTSEHQRMKLAAIEAEWETHEPPAGFNVVAWPDMDKRENTFEFKIPWLLGLIATRSIDGKVEGINDLVELAKLRIKQGITGYEGLKRYREDPDDDLARQDMEANSRFIGYALLLKRYREDVENATEAEIAQAAWDTVPDVPVLFWAFRVMAGLGFYFIAFFAFAFYITCRLQHTRRRWFLWVCLFTLPTPWIAAELGWIVAEYGRQPWIIEGIMPTFMGVSAVSAGQVWFSLIGFVIFYSVLALVDVFLLVKYVRKGPEGTYGAPAAGPRAVPEAAE
ncbi:MAG: cytochrome ubiquinol oxidase subunit I [Pseudomonadota bacterium]